MNLYEIPLAMQGLIDSETGEVIDYESFLALAGERDAKIEALALTWKSANAMSKALKDEKKNLEARIAQQENIKKRIGEHLRAVLGDEKFETARCAVRFQKTPQSVQVEGGEEEKVVRYLETHYDNCLRYKEPEIDRKALKELMSSGVKIPGVSLQSGVSVRIT